MRDLAQGYAAISWGKESAEFISLGKWAVGSGVGWGSQKQLS